MCSTSAKYSRAVWGFGPGKNESFFILPTTDNCDSVKHLLLPDMIDSASAKMLCLCARKWSASSQHSMPNDQCREVKSDTCVRCQIIPSFCESGRIIVVRRLQSGSSCLSSALLVLCYLQNLDCEYCLLQTEDPLAVQDQCSTDSDTPDRQEIRGFVECRR